MVWKNFDLLASYEALRGLDTVDVKTAMAGENGAKRVAEYKIPMSNGMVYSYAAKQVDDKVLDTLQALADEAALTEKYAELYNGAVINTGEGRLVLHQLCRGQLGNDVIKDGENKREFYVSQQNRIAEFANKVHNGEILNEKGEK
jgi:glucose-6-phosphate isomerase